MRNADSSYARFACKECVMRNFFSRLTLFHYLKGNKKPKTKQNKSEFIFFVEAHPKVMRNA